MSDNPEGFREAEKAIEAVASRVRAFEYNKYNKRWSFDTKKFEEQKYGLNKQSKKKGKNNPTPGPSGFNKGRVVKQATRRLDKNGKFSKANARQNKIANAIRAILED